MTVKPPEFDTVIRGYERGQVDAFVAVTNEMITKLRAELVKTQQQRRQATEHAESTEVELRELRSALAHNGTASVDDSFGYRAEKLLRMAQQEADDVRRQAARESALLIERAQTEAERHRHEVEQSLIARAAQLERQAAHRTAELQEREEQITDQIAIVRNQTDRLHVAAVGAADRLQEQSLIAAEETKRRAEAAAKRQLEEAAKEITELSARQTDIRADLASLAQLLGSELFRRTDSSTTPHDGAPARHSQERHRRKNTSMASSFM